MKALIVVESRQASYEPLGPRNGLAKLKPPGQAATGGPFVSYNDSLWT